MMNGNTRAYVYLEDRDEHERPCRRYGSPVCRGLLSAGVMVALFQLSPHNLLLPIVSQVAPKLQAQAAGESLLGVDNLVSFIRLGFQQPIAHPWFQRRGFHDWPCADEKYLLGCRYRSQQIKGWSRQLRDSKAVANSEWAFAIAGSLGVQDQLISRDAVTVNFSTTTAVRRPALRRPGSTIRTLGSTRKHGRRIREPLQKPERDFVPGETEEERSERKAAFQLRVQTAEAAMREAERAFHEQKAKLDKEREELWVERRMARIAEKREPRSAEERVRASKESGGEAPKVPVQFAVDSIPRTHLTLRCLRDAGLTKFNDDGKDAHGCRYTRIMTWSLEDILGFFSRLQEAVGRSKNFKYLIKDSMACTVAGKFKLRSRKKAYKLLAKKNVVFPVPSSERPARFRQCSPLLLRWECTCLTGNRQKPMLTEHIDEGESIIDITIPYDMAGQVIGKDGAHVMAIEQTTGAEIDVSKKRKKWEQSKEPATAATVTVKGTAQAVKDAAAAVRQRCMLRNMGEIMVDMTIPPARAGYVIGTGGQTIKAIEECTGARIQFSDDGETITLKGTSEQIADAEAAIRQACRI